MHGSGGREHGLAHLPCRRHDGAGRCVGGTTAHTPACPRSAAHTAPFAFLPCGVPIDWLQGVWPAAGALYLSLVPYMVRRSRQPASHGTRVIVMIPRSRAASSMWGGVLALMSVRAVMMAARVQLHGEPAQHAATGLPRHHLHLQVGGACCRPSLTPSHGRQSLLLEAPPCLPMCVCLLQPLLRRHPTQGRLLPGKQSTNTTLRHRQAAGRQAGSGDHEVCL